MEHTDLNIYAVADLHGDYDRLHKIRETLGDCNVDLMVIAGDITGLFGGEKFIQDLAALALPMLVIPGNMDTGRLEETVAPIENITFIHRRRIQVGGVPFVGLGGTSPLPFSNRIGLREQNRLEEVEHLIDGACVLVTHPPPHGVLDEVMGGIHTGSKRLRALIEEKQPRLLICGHIHERPGWAHIGRTVVVNASVGKSGAGALISLRGDTPPEVQLL